MPGTGYDDEAIRVGRVRSARPWWLKIVVVAIAAGAGLASLFR